LIDRILLHGRLSIPSAPRHLQIDTDQLVDSDVADTTPANNW